MKQVFKHSESEFSVQIDGNKSDRELEKLLTSKIEEMMLGGTDNVPRCLCEIDIWNKLEVQFCDDKIMIWGDEGLVELDWVEPAITITL